MSAIVWGSGQALNKQWLKGIMLFCAQVALVCWELFSGTLNVLRGVTESQFRNCGFFTKGIWGLVTLGEIPRASSRVKVYDHSTMLLIGGLLAVLILALFMVIYIMNIRDAYKTRKSIEAGVKLSSIKSLHEGFEKSFEYISITPGLLMLLFVSFIPILFSMLVVFTNYNTWTIPPKNLVDWTGFQTFKDIITLPIWSRTFIYLFIWTTIWAFAAAFSSYFAGMIQAVLLNSSLVKYKKLFRSIYMLPWAIPGMVTILTFRSAFHTRGPVNRFLLETGIIHNALPFLSEVNFARVMLVVVNMWLGFPYFMALISGIMTTINTDMFEAAQIDGANSMQVFRRITFPYIISATAPQLIFSVTYNFNNFGLVYFLTGGGPRMAGLQMADATDILITWIYKLTVDQRMYNYAAAMSIFIFILLATVSGVNLSRTRAFKEE